MGLLSRFIRGDSWLSTITGLGDPSRDKTLTFGPQLDLPLDTGTIQSLMMSDDIAYRILTGLPSRAMKDGFGFAVSDDGEIDPIVAQEQLGELQAACEKFAVRDKVYEADTLGRAYGFAGLLLGIEGAGAPDTPLDDENPSGRLRWLQVIDRREMIPSAYYDDPTDEKFGEVQFYNVVETSYSGAVSQRIHESRIIRFGGALTPRRERLQNSGCDYSVLQRIYPVLRQVNGSWASLCALMADMSQGVYKINGLTDMIAAGNEDNLKTRMSFLDAARSVTRSIVLDAEHEEFQRQPTPMGGVNEVMEQSWKRLAAAAEMPMTVLMGVSPAGLNATGESDMRLWYDTVKAHQEKTIAPRIQRVAWYLSRDLGHAAPDGWVVTFPSLWQLTAPEQALYRLQVAQADAAYITAGVLLPEEVALSRFASGDEFDGSTTTIDVDSRKKALALSVADITDPTRNDPPPVPALPPKPGAGKPGDIGDGGAESNRTVDPAQPKS